MGLLLAALVLAFGVLLLFAVFPPRNVPRWFRRASRPLRRRLRPRHYRAW